MPWIRDKDVLSINYNNVKQSRGRQQFTLNLVTFIMGEKQAKCAKKEGWRQKRHTPLCKPQNPNSFDPVPFSKPQSLSKEVLFQLIYFLTIYSLPSSLIISCRFCEESQILWNSEMVKKQVLKSYVSVFASSSCYLTND